MSQTISTKKLGELLHHWHDSQSDPIYATGSLLFAGKPVDEELIKTTREAVSRLLSQAERGSHGWGQDEVLELRTIRDGLGGLLRVYEYGELPTLADFRSHLSHDRNDQGHRYISSSKPILSLELDKQSGVAASQAAQAADERRASAGKGKANITLDVVGSTVKVHINDIESLYFFIEALVAVGGAGKQVAETLMQDLGYSWTGKSNPRARRNPAGMLVRIVDNGNGTTTVSNSDESYTFATKAVRKALWFEVGEAGHTRLDWAEWVELIDTCYAEHRKLKPRKRNPGSHTESGSVRARRIVKLAAKKVKASSVKSWLTLDEHGVWEKEALNLLQTTSEKAEKAGLPESRVDDEIATYLAYLALEATLANAKKRARK